MLCLVVVVLDINSLDLGQQLVLGVGNGYQTPGRCSVKVNLNVDTVIILFPCDNYFNIIAVDCGRPSVNMNVNSTCNSTSFNSRLILTCPEGLLPSGDPIAQCYSDGSWAPDPSEFTCKSTASLNQSKVVYK